MEVEAAIHGHVLVTGGAGFIGSHLVDYLVAHGADVTVLDDFSTGSCDNLAVSAGPRLRVIEDSILDRRAVDEAIKGCDRVYHMAVQCVRRSLHKPIENHDVNATGTLNLLESARYHRVRRFVYCSSSEVYGNALSGVLAEREVLCEPTTVYGAAKLAGEYYTKAYQRTYGLNTVIVRPFNSYGPREHATGDLAEVIPRFVIRVLNGLPPIVFGAGDGGRDFTYVTDTARGIALSGETESAVGSVLNLAYGEMITINEVAGAVAGACGRPKLEPVHVDPRPGDVCRLQADTRLAEQLLGYRAAVDFREGLERYLRWFREVHPDPSTLLEDDPMNWRMPDTL